MKSRGVTPIKNRLIEEKTEHRYLSPPPIIIPKKTFDTPKYSFKNKFQFSDYSLTNSPLIVKESSKILSSIDKKIFRKRKGKNFQTQSVPLEDKSLNKEKKFQNLKKSRIHLQYLKKNLNNRNCSLSILDFWSNEMLVNATRQVINSDLIQKPETPIRTITIPKKPFNKVVKSTKNLHPIPLDEYLEKIDKACDKTFSETQKIKTSLARSMKYLNKSNN